MSKKFLMPLVFALTLFMVMGCASKMQLAYEQTRTNALVEIKTVTGKSCNGLIRAKKPSFLVIQTDKNDSKKLAKIDRDDIAFIAGPKQYVYDGSDNIISDWEIDKTKKSNNFLLFTLGGGGLSFGASFFMGSLLNRGMEDPDEGKQAMWATTAVGTAIGTFLFARAGAKRDRLAAIELIRNQRFDQAKKLAEEEKLKRKKIQEELDRLKAERKQQDEEIKKLMEESKKKKENK